MATSEVSLRPITEQDLRRIYEWRIHPAIRSQMFSGDIFSYEEHLKFWGSRLGNGACFMVISEDMEVGMVKLERRELGFEVDIFISPQHHGKGFGSKAVALIKENARALGIKRIYAKVKKGNDVSLHIFEKNGFKDLGSHLECDL